MRARTLGLASLVLVALAALLWLAPARDGDSRAALPEASDESAATKTAADALPVELAHARAAVEGEADAREPRAAIRFRVVDALTRAPIEGAALTLRRGDELVLRRTADAQGRVAVERTNGLTVRFEAKSYSPIVLRDVPQPGDPEVVIGLHPLGTLRVLVLEKESERPLRDVSIFATASEWGRWDREHDAWPFHGADEVVAEDGSIEWRTRPPSTTDERGELFFPGLPCGVAMTVLVSKGAPSASQPVTIDPDTRAAEVTFRVPTSAVVFGRVVKPDGTPAERPTIVLLEPPGMRGPPRAEGIDGQGRYRFEGVPLGPVQLGLSRIGAEVLDLTVAPGENEVRDLVAVELEELAGRVDSRWPLDGFWIELYGRGTKLGHAAIDESGRFRRELPPGTYTVVLKNPASLPDRQVVDAREVLLPLSEPVVFDADAHLGCLELEGQWPSDESRVTVALRALDAAEQPDVTRPPGEHGLFAPNLAPSDGLVRIPHVPPGEYEIEARSEGYQAVAHARIAAGEVARVGLLDAGLRVIGTAGDGERPLPERVVAFERPGGVHYRTETDAAGAFALDGVLPGTYATRVGEGEDGIDTGEVDLLTDGQVVHLVAAPRASVRVSVSRAGAPAPDVRVALQGDGSRSVDLRTGADGSCVFEDVVPRAYRVSAVLGDGVGPVLARHVELAPGERAHVALDHDLAPYEVRFTVRGEPLVSPANAHLLFEDPSTGLAVRSIGRVDGDVVRFEARPVRAAFLVQPRAIADLTLREAEPWLVATADLAASDSPDSPHSKVRVELARHELEIELAPDALAAPWPRFYVDELDGIPIERIGMTVRLTAESDGDMLRLPLGVRSLRGWLVGLGADRREAARPFAVSAPARLSWP